MEDFAMSSPENMSTPPVTPERVMQFAWGYAPPLMLEAGVRLGVFDALADAPKTLEQVATQTGASQRGLRALLNALTGLGLLTKDAENCYGLVPDAAAFLVQGRPGYLGGFLRHISGQLMPNWMHLTEVIRTGRPAASVNQTGAGTEFFEPFVEGIFPMSYPGAQALGQALELSQASEPVRVLDLASGSGVWGIALAQQSPHVRVTAVDWPGVLPVTRRVAGQFGVADRFEYREGDLSDADFGSGYNVATLGHILHSEGAERRRALLHKTFAALAPGGTIVIAEWLVNDERTAPPHCLIFAANMLVNTDDGDTFTFGEIASWLTDAGFTNVRTLEAPGPSPLILATRGK
jgi:precorrin-6B methylase 2